MIRQSFGIYKRDMKTILTNYAVLITVIALCILPSLYAWINIKASWDPYSSQATSRIKVAVVNLDKGAAINDKTINAGDKVVEGLKDNTALGWQFMGEDEAMKALRKGKIYAMIVIPETFSQDLTSLATNDVRKADIKYIVNEKLNAIAPKITSKGASGIQTTISEEVVSTVSNIVLSMAKELGIEVEDVVLPKLLEAGNVLHQIEGRFTDVEQTLSKTQNGVKSLQAFLAEAIGYVPKLEKMIMGVQDMSGTIQDFMNTAKTGIDTLAPTIKKDIGLVSDISGEAVNYIDSISSLIETNSDKVPEMIDNVLAKADAIDKLLSSLIKLMKGIDNIAESSSLEAVITKLETAQAKLTKAKENLEAVKAAIESGSAPDMTLLENTKQLLQDVGSIADSLYDDFDPVILAGINDVFDKASAVITDSDDVLADIKAKLPELLDMMIRAQEVLQKGSTELDKVQALMPELEAKITALTDKIDEVNQDQEIKDLIKLLKEDVQRRADFLADSTTINEETIFPMGNYGSQMAPFYSSLAAWVGLTILVSMISVECKGNYKSYEVYFGKLMTYLTLTIIQGLIISLGDIYLLGIYCLNPGLFILGMFLVSISFTLIVYSLVSVFGNVGKVVAIILMIIQVAGSGGTFPVQLTSNFFIAVNPYLPFTYAISILREAIGGVEESVLAASVAALAAFIVGSIIISLVLKKYMNKAMAGFVHKVHEGGL